MAAVDSTLKALLQPVVEALGCELWGLQLESGGKRKLLRIYIDREEGIAVEDCERVSRQSSAVLDVEDAISGEYVLEVSSPGMDRPLYELSQYERYIGEDVSLRLRFAYDGRRNFKGRQSIVSDFYLIYKGFYENKYKRYSKNKKKIKIY